MILLVDIGGTYTRIAIAENLKRIKNFTIYPTKYKYKEFIEFIKTFNKKEIKVACFGIAGMLDKEKSKVIYSPSLKDFINKKLKTDLEKILKTKIILENDAILGAIGESYYGRGKNFYSFGYITLGTGIGGAKIVNKNIDNNNFGFEPGHSIVFIEKIKKFFEIEKLIGGKNIKEKYGLISKKLKNKNFSNFYYNILSVLIINTSIFWSVDKIILGGSISKIINYKYLNKICKNKHPLPIKIKIYSSKLKNKSTIYGGLIKCQNYM